MHPFTIAPVPTLPGRGRLGRIAAEPLRDIEVEELLAPDHAGVGLALNAARVLVGHALLQLLVELIGLAEASSKRCVEILEGSAGIGSRSILAPQPQAQPYPASRRHLVA